MNKSNKDILNIAKTHNCIQWFIVEDEYKYNLFPFQNNTDI